MPTQSGYLPKKAYPIHAANPAVIRDQPRILAINMMMTFLEGMTDHDLVSDYFTIQSIVFGVKQDSCTEA